MKALILALAILLVGCESVEVRVKPATARIETPTNGGCSATYIGPRLLLSASHCFAVDSGPITINGKPGQIISVRHDGQDMALAVVSIESKHWARVGKNAAQGDAIFYYGNPVVFRDALRRGYVVGTHEHRTLVDMSIGKGDSGAGVFNERGEVVGVVSAIYSADHIFHLGAIRLIADGFMP